MYQTKSYIRFDWRINKLPQQLKKGFARPKDQITEVGYMYVSWTQEMEIEEKHPLEQW